MDMEAYTQFEIARIESYLESIKRSVNNNTSLDAKEKEEIIRLTARLYNDEIDYLERNPEDYYALYTHQQ